MFDSKKYNWSISHKISIRFVFAKVHFILYSPNMNVYLVLGLNFLPFILFLVILLFSKVKASKLLLPLLFMLFSLVPIILIQYVVSPLFSDRNVQQYGLLILLLGAILDFGLVEEGFKSLALLFAPSKDISFSHFFIISMLAGLLLGCCESTIYFLNGVKGMLSNTPSRSVEILPVVFLRMATSDMIHMLCAGLCGVFVWTAKSKKINFFPLIGAVFVHGLYDYFILVQLNVFFALVTLLFAASQCRIWYVRIKNNGSTSNIDDAAI